MENKQGCIDWLVEEINKQKAWADPSKLEPIIQQAKAMHKEEIVNIWTEATAPMYEIGLSDTTYILAQIKKAEQYYNETFGGDNETH